MKENVMKKTNTIELFDGTFCIEVPNEIQQKTYEEISNQYPWENIRPSAIFFDGNDEDLLIQLHKREIAKEEAINVDEKANSYAATFSRIIPGFIKYGVYKTSFNNIDYAVIQFTSFGLDREYYSLYYAGFFQNIEIGVFFRCNSIKLEEKHPIFLEVIQTLKYI